LSAALARPGLASDTPLKIVATTGMIADAVRVLSGEGAEITGLMGPGVDPHAYRRTRSDIAAMLGADLALWHSLYLEAQMEEFLLDLSQRRRVKAVGEAVPHEKLRGHDQYAGRYDPPIWMDPDLWAFAVAAIRDEIVSVAPDGAVDARAEAYLAEIARLSAYARERLATVPAPARVLLTAPGAFGHFGAAYGFEVIGIQGISTESGAGLDRIGELVELIVSRGLRAVFVESSVSDRNIRALIEGAAARGHEVGIGGELFSDAMGEPGTYGGTYLGMIGHNLTLIAPALGGEAPERGRQIAGGLVMEALALISKDGARLAEPLAESPFAVHGLTVS
jgi:manganese/zinc/iron transport system substrate-binding protein